ncbi:hypothetical protein CJF42_06980 [Pseudoalteromonas sp. NBT06-2]|nr:hypothetical protein CJF42_06980 [Pseudoalteromonas sp. NBT06-2]
MLLAQGVPVISIMGAKGVGKTTSAAFIALGLKKHGKVGMVQKRHVLLNIRHTKTYPSMGII